MSQQELLARIIATLSSLGIRYMVTAVLDLDYMRHWASVLGVADLLDQIIAQANNIG